MWSDAVRAMECRVTPVGDGYPYKEPSPTLLSSSFLTQRNNLFPQEKVVASGGWERWEPHGGGMAWRSAYSL